MSHALLTTVLTKTLFSKVSARLNFYFALLQASFYGHTILLHNSFLVSLCIIVKHFSTLVMNSGMEIKHYGISKQTSLLFNYYVLVWLPIFWVIWSSCALSPRHSVPFRPSVHLEKKVGSGTKLDAHMRQQVLYVPRVQRILMFRISMLWEQTKLYGYHTHQHVQYQGRSQDFGEGGAQRWIERAQSARLPAAQRKIWEPEATPLNNYIIINYLSSWVWPDLLFAKTEAILATKDYLSQ